MGERQPKDSGKRERVDDCPSTIKYKVLPDAEKCLFDPLRKRAKIHNQALTSQIFAPRSPPPGLNTGERNELAALTSQISAPRSPPQGLNKGERNDLAGALSLFRSSVGFTQDLPGSSKQKSHKVIVQFVQTLPYCHLQIWPSKTPWIVLAFLFLFTIHGLWGIGDKAKRALLPEDNELIREDLAVLLRDPWPSLVFHTVIGAQLLWSHEWNGHGCKLGIFSNKEEYVAEALLLHNEYELSLKLSLAVALLRSVDSEDLKESLFEGVRWFGVRASRLYRILRSFIGDGILIKCNRDADNYLLLDEITLLFEYDTRRMTREIVSHIAYPQFRNWRCDNAFEESDIIWFVTKESAKQV